MLPKRALTDIDIMEFARKIKIPYFRGIFMRDELAQRQAPRKYESAIVNLDSSNGAGTHWVAYRKRGDKIYYFDSFGDLKPPLELVNYFKNYNIYFNYDNYQKFNTYNCGHLCIEFLLNKDM